MDASTLRSEIVESQKFKIDLMKWKLLLAAGLGTAALGIEKDRGVPILLGLVPLVCAYVDVICYHTDLRVLAIGRFCRRKLPAAELAREYEVYCQGQRNVFKLENFALYWATFALSVLTVLGAFGLPHLVLEAGTPGARVWAASMEVARAPVAAAGAVGLIASALIRSYYRDSAAALDRSEAPSGSWLPSGALVFVAGAASTLIGVVLVGMALRPAALDRGAIGAFTLVAGLLCSGVAVQRWRAQPAEAARPANPTAGATSG